jgi:excisionase family DNA binding protein
MTGLLTTKEAARRLGLTRQAVQLMIQENRINAIWMLERWAIPETEVHRVRAARRARKKPEPKVQPQPEAAVA